MFRAYVPFPGHHPIVAHKVFPTVALPRPALYMVYLAILYELGDSMPRERTWDNI